MKKLACVLALASTSAFAQELQLGDLNFFQSQGSVQWNTDLAYTRGTYDMVESGETDEFRTSSLLWNNAVTYGVSDKLNLGLGVSYAARNREFHEKAANPPKDKRTESEGLSDVTVLGNYRLMNTGYYVDLLAGLTLGFGDQEIAQSSSAGVAKGNFNQGHHSLRLGAAAGQKMMNNWEWRATAGIDYHLDGEGKLIDPSNTAQTKFDSDAYTNFFAGAAAQYRHNMMWAFAASLDYLMTGEQTLKVSTASIKTESDGFFTLGLEAKYNVNAMTLVTLGYALTPGYDQDLTEGTDVTKKKNDLAHRFVLGGKFLF